MKSSIFLFSASLLFASTSFCTNTLPNFNYQLYQQCKKTVDSCNHTQSDYETRINCQNHIYQTSPVCHNAYTFATAYGADNGFNNFELAQNYPGIYEIGLIYATADGGGSYSIYIPRAKMMIDEGEISAKNRIVFSKVSKINDAIEGSQFGSEVTYAHKDGVVTLKMYNQLWKAGSWREIVGYVVTVYRFDENYKLLSKTYQFVDKNKKPFK